MSHKRKLAVEDFLQMTFKIVFCRKQAVKDFLQIVPKRMLCRKLAVEDFLQMMPKRVLCRKLQARFSCKLCRRTVLQETGRRDYPANGV